MPDAASASMDLPCLELHWITDLTRTGPYSSEMSKYGGDKEENLCIPSFTLQSKLLRAHRRLLIANI